MITVQDEDEEGENTVEGDEGVQEVCPFEEGNPQLSIHALDGTYNFQTIRLIGSVGKKILYILIDSGSTHNFIDIRTASRLGCIMDSVNELKVTTANGSELRCKEICRKFVWKMQGQVFEAKVLALPLDNYDLVLGI